MNSVKSPTRSLPGVEMEQRSPRYGWVRRVVYGGGGWSGAAWRGLGRPLAWGWRLMARRRLTPGSSQPERLPAPVVSVGNVTVGGGGKTTLVRWLLAEGLPPGVRAAILSRGYGRAGRGVTVVAPGESFDAARRAGDEPLLLARDGAWVGVGADRAGAARALSSRMQADLYVLDDGLQHRRIARALDLVAFTQDDLLAPARCLPAGPLRQGPGWIPARGAWVVAGDDPREQDWPAGTIGAAFTRWWNEMPGTAARWADGGTVTLASWRAGRTEPFHAGERPVVAFAGVARPASVARFAAEVGISVGRVVAFRDHHSYSQGDFAGLLRAHPEAALVTTEKDAVKCELAWFGERPVGVIRRRLEPRDPGLLRNLLREAIAWPR
ncbi:tetraacyldisaccharide 4'-kinase [soil metagenome]